jgi:hypothetical protein
MSFWVKATKTGTYCVVLRNAGADRVYPVEYTINNPGTWEKKTIVIPLNTGVASGTWNYTNGIGLTIRFIIAAGSSYANGTNATWGTAGAGGTSNQVNGLDSTNNDFYITGVQLEKGSVATDFEFRSFATELALCQRYYQVYGGFATNQLFATAIGASTTTANCCSPYSPRMRTQPTISFSAPGDFKLGIHTATAISAITSQTGDGMVMFQVTIANSDLVANVPYFLTANNSNARMYLSAEL